jgi:hypothetical protein
MANSSNKELDNIEHYNAKKFHLWKFQMHALFMGKKLLGIVDGSEVEPTTVGVAQANWKKCDNQMINLLCQAFSKKYRSMLLHATLHMLFETRFVLSKSKTLEKMSMH